ncbi:MAG: lipoate protein ligase C-terminal domain-containing protein [Candidatus Woesearchaeota archaeon]
MIEHKVLNGKLLQIEAEIEETIQSIRITGDFFVHPESALEDIERLLIGVKVEDVEKVLGDFIEKNDVEIIGFGPNDLAEALRK